MRNDTIQWLIPVLLAIAVAIALAMFGIFRDVPEDEPLPRTEMPAEPEPEESGEPLHPLREPADMNADRPALRPLPPLDRSDEYFKLDLSGLFGQRVSDLLVDSRVIERIVATVDALPREHVAQRIRPVGSVEGQFAVEDTGEEGRYVLSEDNYDRYDELVRQIVETDLAAINDLYRRYYPLMQKAYTELGYPDAYFNDRVVEVIDHLLATPEPDEAPVLERPHVLYEYADEEYRELSSGQKLLLRMGNEHARAVKDKLRQFRELISSE